MSPTPKQVKEEIVKFFEETDKTSWGKNEIVKKINELYTDLLERYVY